MPPKTPGKTPAENATETAGVFGYAAELTARIDKEGPDTVYVRVTRDVDGSSVPEFLHDYPGGGWSLEAMRNDFGPGNYTCTLNRRAGHVYVVRRAIAVGPAPRTSATPAPAPAPTPTAAAPVLVNGIPMPTDPMGMMLVMQMENARQAREDARRADERNARLMEAIVSRTQGDPLDQLAKLAPLIQRDSTSTEALKLADQLARRYQPAGRDRSDDDEQDEGGALGQLGQMLAPIVASLIRGAMQPAPQQPRRVPNTAAPQQQTNTQEAGNVGAHAPAPSGGNSAGVEGAPSTPAPQAAPPLKLADNAEAKPGDDYPASLTYTAAELDTIDEYERRAEDMNQHAMIGTIAGVLKLRAAYPDPSNAAREINSWFYWWEGDNQDDAEELATIVAVREAILNECAAIAAGYPSDAVNMLAEFAQVNPGSVYAVAGRLWEIRKPTAADVPPAPAPGAPAVGTPQEQPVPPPPPPPPAPTPPPAPEPARPTRRKPRSKP